MPTRTATVNSRQSVSLQLLDLRMSAFIFLVVTMSRPVVFSTSSSTSSCGLRRQTSPTQPLRSPAARAARPRRLDG